MRYLKNSYRLLKHIIVVPLLYTLVVPIIITDIWIEIYHRICFPLCGIPYVKRRNYIKIDRHKLKYLNLFQKIYCVYCGYTNGVIQYWVKIAGETEQYWCGVQHKKNPDFIAPSHHKNFAEYNNESDFNQKYKH